MSATPAPAVEIRDVGMRFGAVTALDGIDLTVAPGTLYGLIGPDGAGKTTLFRILATLLVPDSGTVRVLGQDAVDDLWALRRRIGYMPGRFALYPDLSVAENLAFFAQVFGTTAAAGEALIAPIYAQLAPFAGRAAGALSGGMKQKLALCCALVHRPDILFLDEPTTGVDAVSRREFWDLLASLRSDGLTIVVATPYMDEAARCDRIALLQDGRVLAVDAPADVGARYPRPLVAVRADDRAALLAVLRRLPDVASVWPFGESVHVSDRRLDLAPAAVAAALHQPLVDAGLTGVDVRPVAPGIEDVFIDLMQAPSAGRAA